MVIAPFVVGLGAFTVFYGLLGNKSHNSSLVAKGFTWIGKHSYSLYLIHHPVIALLVPRRALVGILLSVIVTVIGAIFLEALINGVLNILSSWHKKYGLVATGVRITLVGLAVFICAIGIELAVQQVNPQEAEGWGERPSLEPHAVFGWRLKPNQTTRLRWESYDYYVIANELGFPGPAYPEHKTSDTIRILTFGDAFTSAEGVNTEQAWSRLLEKNLASRLPSHKIEVMNFAITGYGPNQYTAVAETFVPKYQPDLIIIGFFANDYTDVSMSNDDFHSGIGFGLPSGHGWYTTIRLLHTRILLAHELQRLANTIRSKPDLGKYSGAAMLQQQQLDYEITGRQKVADRLKQIKTIADKVGAQMMIAMIPMPVQVCGPDEITYYPSGFDLTDPAQFDLDKPQRLTQKIAGNLELEYFDLRSPLQAMEECPYQPRNLHWTAAGHQAVADYMANVLLADSHYLSSLNKELNK
jgi:lysophospholipase L1-like esterase